MGKCCIDNVLKRARSPGAKLSYVSVSLERRSEWKKKKQTEKECYK